LVAVVEIAFDEEGRLPAAITALATKPSLRQRGIGTKVLHMILKLHHSEGISEHVAYISVDHEAGQRCLTKAGFVAVSSRPDSEGYIEFRHHA
jgi:ribosomal protein S18 acetylase RimI-like enzyme